MSDDGMFVTQTITRPASTPAEETAQGWLGGAQSRK